MSDMPPDGIPQPHGGWLMPPFRPGNPGRPLKYPPNRLRNKCADYMATQDQQGKPYAKAGVARFLGITRPAWDKYAAGKIGKSETERAALVTVCEYFMTCVEEQREEMLLDKERYTPGLPLALKQLGWRDDKHITVDAKEERTINLQLPQALQNKLLKARGELIEGECTEVVQE